MAIDSLPTVVAFKLLSDADTAWFTQKVHLAEQNENARKQPLTTNLPVKPCSSIVI